MNGLSDCLYMYEMGADNTAVDHHNRECWNKVEKDMFLFSVISCLIFRTAQPLLTH